MANATPTKLRSGAWGAKVQGSVREGEQVQITTRAGKSWMATVAKVVWSAKGVSIVATSSAGSSSHGHGHGHGRRGTRTGCSCGSVNEYTKPTDCWTCQHDAD